MRVITRTNVRVISDRRDPVGLRWSADAYTYMYRGKVFANAQTGNIVLLAQNLVDRNWQAALRYFSPLLFFALGVAMAECIRMRYQKAQKIHWRQLVLVMEIVLLFAVGFFPNDIDLLANAMVSFACAMQVQAFRKVNGYAFASTMCIGNLRSGMESLCAYGKTEIKRYCENPVIISESSSCSPSVRHWEDT